MAQYSAFLLCSVSPPHQFVPIFSEVQFQAEHKGSGIFPSDQSNLAPWWQQDEIQRPCRAPAPFAARPVPHPPLSPPRPGQCALALKPSPTRPAHPSPPLCSFHRVLLYSFHRVSACQSTFFLSTCLWLRGPPLLLHLEGFLDRLVGATPLSCLQTLTW